MINISKLDSQQHDSSKALVLTAVITQRQKDTNNWKKLSHSRWQMPYNSLIFVDNYEDSKTS